MKVSELEMLERIQKPSQSELDRISSLKQANKPTKRVKVERPETPPLWMGLDKVHIMFNGPIEPWDIVRCTTCKSKYHLVDGADCLCGRDESIERRNYHLGEIKV